MSRQPEIPSTLKIKTVTGHLLRLKVDALQVFSGALYNARDPYGRPLAFAVVRCRGQVRIGHAVFATAVNETAAATLWLGGAAFDLKDRAATQVSEWLAAHDAQAATPAKPNSTEEASA